VLAGCVRYVLERADRQPRPLTKHIDPSCLGASSGCERSTAPWRERRGAQGACRHLGVVVSIRAAGLAWRVHACRRFVELHAALDEGERSVELFLEWAGVAAGVPVAHGCNQRPD
jgi:hypothetical protein